MKEPRFRKGDYVKIVDKAFYGRIVVVDRKGGGQSLFIEPSYDIEGKFIGKEEVWIYKHVPDSEVEIDPSEKYRDQ